MLKAPEHSALGQLAPVLPGGQVVGGMFDYVGNSLCDRILAANLCAVSGVTCLADFRYCPRPSSWAPSALTHFHLHSS